MGGPTRSQQMSVRTELFCYKFLQPQNDKLAQSSRT